MAEPRNTTAADATAAELQTQGRALRTLARSLLRGAGDADADDVVQDAFAQELATRPEPANRFGWLVRVVQNFARRRRREDARRQHRHERLPASSPAPAVDDVVAQVEMHRIVAEAVLQLGEPCRRTLVLRFWHDLPPRAIAQRLGVPVATVKTHLQRALAELRQRLDRRTGGRRAWLTALVPIAHPQLPASPGAPLVLGSAAAFAAMNTKLVAFVLAACLCVGMFVWEPWSPQAGPAGEAVASGNVDPARGDVADARTTVIANVPAAASESVASAAADGEREPAGPAVRMCTVVGKIVAGDVPAVRGRIRLVHAWDHDAPPVTGEAGADGTFALPVPRPHDWISYRLALADAPGFAVRELEIRVGGPITDDRLDLGTFRLERGVAVAGRVVEADGSPLRGRVRLLTWDPSRSGSWAALNGGRTVGFAEPGGQFALGDRIAAGKNGAWMLAAVGASGVGWATLAFASGQDHLDPVEIRLLPGGSADVTVVDADGRPIADAQVQATPYFQPIGLASGWEPSVVYQDTHRAAEVEELFVRRTDADGRAGFVNLPRRDDARVRDANRNQRGGKAIIVSAAKAGYVVNGTTFDPGIGGAAAVTITLSKQRRVAFHGTIATADGTRLGGIRVRSNGDDHSCTTDAEGRYELAERIYESNLAYFLIDGGDVPLVHASVAIPPDGERVAHDFVVEHRAPVTGRVVDQFGQPVAGVRLHLGIAKSVHYPSQPERTGADGTFAFPDAVASHDELWVLPPDPQTAWRVAGSRKLARRDGEVVTVHRFEGPLVDLTLALVDGQRGTPVSPTEVQIHQLSDNTVNYRAASVRPELALGAATAPQLPSGRYRATVRAEGLAAEHDFTLPADAPKHDERVELWPAVAIVCTVDASALPAAELATRQGKLALVLLASQTEQSFLVDAAGKPANMTRNTGAVRFGGDMTFRLERVTPNVRLRLYTMHDGLFGETWFTAAPGADAHVALRFVPFGRIEFALPAAWPDGDYAIDVHDGAAWRNIVQDGHRAEAPPCVLQRPPGDARWRLRLCPDKDGTVVERTGTTTVRVGTTTRVPLE